MKNLKILHVLIFITITSIDFIEQIVEDFDIDLLLTQNITDYEYALEVLY